MKVQRIHIRNFRTLDDVLLNDVPDELAFLIGKNASGKSNLIAAIVYFKEAIKQTGTLPDVYDFGGAGRYDPIRIEMDVHFTPEEILSVVRQAATIGLPGDTLRKFLDAKPEILLSVTTRVKFRIGPRDTVLPEIVLIDRTGRSMIIDLVRQGLTNQGTPLHDSVLINFLALVGKFLGERIQILGPIRKPLPVVNSQGPRELLYDASNLGNTLFPTVAGYSASYEKLISELHEVFPFIERPITPPVENSTMVRMAFRESGLSFPIGVDRASSGQNEALSILTRLITAPPGSFVTIEEPEVHFHQGALRKLMGVILDHSRNGLQILIASHSTELLCDIRLPAEQPIWHFSRVANGPTQVQLFHRERELAKIDAAMSED